MMMQILQDNEEKDLFAKDSIPLSSTLWLALTVTVMWLSDRKNQKNTIS